MAKTIAPLLPPTTELLQRFGDRLRLARMRRRLTAKQVAERAGMVPMTLRSLERGGAGVTMGAYLAVMQVLGIEKDLNLLGTADPLGRELQDARLTAHGGPSIRTGSSASEVPAKRMRTSIAADAALAHSAPVPAPAPAKTIEARPQPRKSTGTWAEKSGFTRAQTLVDLIDARVAIPKKRR